MKKHLIAAAIAATGLMATSAYALPPTTTPDYVIYAGSGSAQANAHYWAAAQLLSNVDSYTDSATCAESGTWRVLFGTTKAAYTDGKGTTIAAGKNVLYMVRFAGGTFANSIGAVANATTLSYPATSAVAGATACGGAPHATYKFASGFATATAIPDFGTSDEEVGLFNTPLNVPGSYTTSGGLSVFHPGAVLSSTATANLTQNGLYVNLIGMAVSLSVYNGTGSFAHAKTNFTKAEIAGILTGGIQNWNQLFADDGTQMPAQAMILLDRAPGSGTKAATSVYFLLNPNAPGGALTPYNESPGGGGPVGAVPSTACSSTVPAAFVDSNEGSSTVLFQDLQKLNTNGCLGIGMLGLEFSPETQGGGYQFVKINGVDPYARTTSGGHTFATYANEINGSYDLMFSNSYNYRTKNVNGGGFYGDGSAHSVFINQFQTTLGSASLPGGVSGQFPAGVPGALNDPAVTGAQGACTTSGSHFGNSLAPLQLFLDATFGAAPACNDQLN